MLHMVVLTHAPETCPSWRPEFAAKAHKCWTTIRETAQGHQTVVQGMWADPPGHVFFLLLDAPNAHAIGDLMGELEVTHWNRVEIHPAWPMG